MLVVNSLSKKIQPLPHTFDSQYFLPFLCLPALITLPNKKTHKTSHINTSANNIYHMSGTKKIKGITFPFSHDSIDMKITVSICSLKKVLPMSIRAKQTVFY